MNDDPIRHLIVNNREALVRTVAVLRAASRELNKTDPFASCTAYASAIRLATWIDYWCGSRRAIEDSCKVDVYAQEDDDLDTMLNDVDAFLNGKRADH